MNCQYCDDDDRKCPGRGLCHCGCGRKTTLHTHTVSHRGIRVGDPCQFVRNHHLSKPHLKTPPLTAKQIKALGG